VPQIAVSPCHRDHRKLVTPEARRDIDLAARGLDPTGDILEELVAGLMPERIVHALESVEVEEQDREFRAKTPMPRQRLAWPAGPGPNRCGRVVLRIEGSKTPPSGQEPPMIEKPISPLRRRMLDECA
jgi:hypothetical protein